MRGLDAEQLANARPNPAEFKKLERYSAGKDAAARKLGLSAVLRVEDGIVEVLPATGHFAHDAPLQLVLEHPTRQADDVRLELAPQGPGWRATQAIDADHDWVVQLRAADGHWRLQGRLPKQQHAARLAPSLGEGH